MKKLAFGLAALAAGLLTSSAAHAASFSVNFCPAANSCPANVTEASLTFTENLATANDLNDYTLDLKIVGGAGNPLYIDQVSFTIDSADNVTGAGGYEAKPTLTAAPGGIGNWSVFYDNINNGSGCSSDTGNSKEVCAQSGVALNSGNGALTNGTNVWSFVVDLADDVAKLGVGSAVNLRAAFVNANGGNGGILSPGGGSLGTTTGQQTTTGQETTSGTTVPEPALLSMLGIGLAGAAYRGRRRS